MSYELHVRADPFNRQTIFHFVWPRRSRTFCIDWWTFENYGMNTWFAVSKMLEEVERYERRDVLQSRVRQGHESPGSAVLPDGGRDSQPGRLA